MYELIGTIGLLFLLVAFVLNLLKVSESDTMTYNILNIAGCLLLTFYAIKLNSIPFLILESVWGLFAVYKLITLLLRNK